MKNIINNITLIFLPIIILLSTIGCDAKMEKFTETRFKMGTIVQITIFEKDKEIAEKQINKAFAEIDRISSLFYEGSLESEIYKFNHRNSDTVEVSSEVSDLLGRANQISKNTFGAFDMTVGTLRDLYNFKKGQEKIPDSIDVLKTIKKIGYNKLHINLRENLLIGDNQYFTLLTGAIVKGYAADRAAKIINKENRNGILINAGGDIRATKRYDNKKWVVGIQNPQKKDELLGTISIFEGAVVTSGDYEQFSIINGKRYHHIINPKTGFSANKSHSATIIASNTELADALATGLFVLGSEKGLLVLDKYPDVECLWVNKKGEIIKSDGFDNFFISR